MTEKNNHNIVDLRKKLPRFEKENRQIATLDNISRFFPGIFILKGTIQLNVKYPSCLRCLMSKGFKSLMPKKHDELYPIPTRLNQISPASLKFQKLPILNF